MMELSSKRVVVMGLGRFGGGVGVTRFLVGQGADVLVTDLEPEERLAESLAALKGLPVERRLGGHNVSDFTTADLVVVNPAVDPRGNRFLRAAQAAGVPCTTEVRLLVERLPERRRTIGITGTAGKSTVTAMIGHILQKMAAGAGVFTGGNLGGSLLGELPGITARDWVVLELSSFMLEGLHEDSWSPHIAVVTNLSPNHLDRHGSFEAYAAAKSCILAYQSEEDHAVLGPGVARQLSHGSGRRRKADVVDSNTKLKVIGEHNRWNAGLAVAAAGCAGFDPDAAAKALESFCGLPHRLEFVAEHHGVRFYNDSKATTPDAVRLALDALAAGPSITPPEGGLHVILGGYDKAGDLTEMARDAARRSKAIYTIGTTGDTIADAAAAGPALIERCGDLGRAVERACRKASPGDAVILSPGCASWDQFDHYEQRGAAFIQAVKRHANVGNAEEQPPLA